MTLFPPAAKRISATLLLLPVIFSAALATSQPREGVPVRVEPVTEQAVLRTVALTGTVTSPRSARLSAATAGLVTALHVDAGSRVEAGAVLLELEPVLAQSQWQSAQAGADVARLAVADSKRRLKEARSLIPQKSIAESAVRDLDAEVAQDDAELQRAEAMATHAKLFSTGIHCARLSRV